MSSVAFQERRFVIKQIHLARAAVHEELNDAFGLGRMVQFARQQAGNRPTEVHAGSEQMLLGQQMGQGNSTESPATTPKKFTARSEWACCSRGVHSFAFADVWS
jgi:hypothetical protein